MQHTAANIQCVNPDCKAANPQSSSICNECGIPVVKRYLWAVIEGSLDYQPGDLIGDRYLVKQSQIVLDTQPATAPQTPETIPQYVTTYLHLFLWRLHVPQIYDCLEVSGEAIYLLEHNTISTDAEGEPLHPQLFPSLEESFEAASAIRQLNWLWQLARLWQPLQDKRVASSLITPHNLRVSGGILKLQQLKFDEATPSWLDLGEFLQPLIAMAQTEVQSVLKTVVEQLNLGKIRNGEDLLVLLEKAIWQQSKSQSFTYEIYSLTESGPTREHNEDACYPPPGKLVKLQDSSALAIVCDGIGGHEGGEVAAGLAIDYLQKSVAASVKTDRPVAPADVEDELVRQTQRANDIISDRNDREQRHERERMGTTLVMTLAANPWLYLTHVGDSRIYLITTSGCQAVTVDDDLASREVRLGYGFYRDVAQYPSTGALVQALGMSNSNNMHPNVDRLVIDEECLFLLCSDGLSDYERVEQYWSSVVLPLLQQNKDIKQVAADLIKIANTRNGHDNATVALLHCQPQPVSSTSPAPQAASISQAPAKTIPPSTAAIPPTEPSTQQVQKTSTPSKSGSNWLMFTVFGLIGASLLAAVAIWGLPLLSNSKDRIAQPKVSSESEESPLSREIPEDSSPASSASDSQANQLLQPGDIIQFQEDLYVISNSDKLIVPAKSILQVVHKQQDLLQVKMCAYDPYSVDIDRPKLLPIEQSGYIRLSTIQNPPQTVLDPEAECN